jgi:hypothetical protein
MTNTETLLEEVKNADLKFKKKKWRKAKISQVEHRPKSLCKIFHEFFKSARFKTMDTESCKIRPKLGAGDN